MSRKTFFQLMMMMTMKPNRRNAPAATGHAVMKAMKAKRDVVDAAAVAGVTATAKISRVKRQVKLRLAVMQKRRTMPARAQMSVAAKRAAKRLVVAVVAAVAVVVAAPKAAKHVWTKRVSKAPLMRSAMMQQQSETSL